MLSSSVVHMTQKKAICWLFHHWLTKIWWGSAKLNKLRPIKSSSPQFGQNLSETSYSLLTVPLLHPHHLSSTDSNHEIQNKLRIDTDYFYEGLSKTLVVQSSTKGWESSTFGLVFTVGWVHNDRVPEAGPLHNPKVRINLKNKKS